MVQVRDAETKQPLVGAEVYLSYPLTPPELAPWNSSGTTAEDGIVRLRVAPNGENGSRLDVTAKGFLAEAKDLADDAVQALKPARFFEVAESRPVNVVVELVAEPPPTVELIVPTGYRGIVKVEVQVQEDAAYSPGQRQFCYPVPPSGLVQASGPPLLHHIGPVDVHARYADGTPLRRDAKKSELGFWWLKPEGKYQCFVIGTRGEFDAFCRAAANEGSGKEHSPGGEDSASRGRRHRRASPSSSEGNPS
jgi:hypothetical protein